MKPLFAPASRSLGSARGREVFSFAALTAGGIGAVTLLALVSPEEPGHYPSCPFLSLTGLYCPGCGSLRAVHALTQGDLATAWDRNPLALILLPAVALAWAVWGLRLLGRVTWTSTRIPAPWIWSLLVLVLVYWVARNIPGWSWLSPL